MKLCYIANANSIHTRRWIEPYLEQGHEIHLLSYKPVEYRWNGLDLVDLSDVTNVPKWRFLRWGIWTRRYVQRVQPDILHAHQVQAAGWLAAMSGYHPCVVTAWGSDLLVEPENSAVRRALVKIVLRRCDELTVPTRVLYDAAVALGFPELHLHLIPWGVETDVFKPRPEDRMATRRHFGIAETAQVVLCPRAISPLYNVDTVLEAVRLIATDLPELRLVLLRFNVDPDYLRLLRCSIASAGMQEVVLWLPPQRKRSDMARLYGMADVAVSIPTSEGYGSSVYEAMAAGCPTVVSDLPVFRDTVEQGVHALKVPPGDPGSTGQAIHALLTNRQLRQSVIHNAIDLCRSQSAELRISQSRALYRRLAGSR